MQPDPVLAHTDELLNLADHLDRHTAAAFIQRVFDAGAAQGAHIAIANTAEEVTARDAQVHRLAAHLQTLGEDPLTITQIISGHRR
ncbi:hypothetical protein [Streptacidiphilus sp. PAMC 29251]|jgi:predicted nicotinamide N-methyase